MNNITDNAFVPTMDAQVTEHFEDTDTIADADGVEARAGQGSHAKTKEQTPDYVLAEFEWKSTVDQTTGETRWFMSPIKSAVEALIVEAPGILHEGIDLLEDEDNALARQLAKDITSLSQTLIGIDTYQETALKRHFVNQMARKASDLQADACESCQRNEWGSAPGGGRGKACKNQIRIAIVPPDAKPDTPPWTIDLAPSSATSFTNFANRVKGQRGLLPLQTQVTIAFNPNADYPTLTFADPEPLSASGMHLGTSVWTGTGSMLRCARISLRFGWASKALPLIGLIWTTGSTIISRATGVVRKPQN